MADASVNLGARLVEASSLAVAMHLREALSVFAADRDVKEFRQRLEIGGAGPDAKWRDLSGAFAVCAAAKRGPDPLSSDAIKDEALSPATRRPAGTSPRRPSLF